MNRTRRKTRPRPKPQSPRAAPVDPARLAQLKAELRELRKQLLLERDDFQANEQAMAETQQELELSRERYANLYDSAPVGYVLLDREGFIREANLTAARMLGVDRQILCEMMLARFIVESDSRRKLLKHLANCRRSASPVQGTTELKLTAADGRQLDVALTSSPEPSLGKRPGKVRLHSVLEDITARKRAEEALRRSEKLYRAIGESIDYGVWVCAADGRNTYASESFLKLVGQTQEQCSNYGWGDVLHPDDAERTIAAWRTCVRTGGTWDIEHRYRGTDGQYHPVLARGVPIQNEQGEITAWAGINLDISRLKQAEAKLQELTQRLTYHVDHSPLAVIEWGPEMRLVRWSGAAERIFGWRAEEVLGRRIEDFKWVCEADQTQVDEVRTDLASGANPRRFSANRNYRKDGSIVHCEWYNSALLDADGKLRSILSLVLDVTGRVRAEEQLRLLSAAVESAGNGVAISNRQGIVQWVNPAFAKLTGYSQAEAVGQNPRVLKSGRQSAEFYREMWDTILAGKVWRGELINRRKDGSLYSEEMTLTPVRVDGAEISHFVAIKQDISARKQAEEALRASEARFRSVFDHAATGIAISDCAGRLVQCNAAYCNLTGYSQSELATMELSALILPEDREQERDFIRGLLDGGIPSYEIENRYRHRDGRPIWMRKHVSTLRDPSGEPTHLIALVTDMTDRKQIEETHAFLARSGYQAGSEEFFRALARHLGQSLGMDLVRIDRLTGDGLTAQTVAILFDGKFEDNVAYALKDTPGHDLVGQTICCFSRDVCRLFPRDAVLQGMEAESYIGTTLWGLDEEPVGLIAVAGRRPLLNPRLAESVLKLVSVRAAGELQRAQAEAALRQARDELEERVRERTAELRRSNENLREEIAVRRQAEQELAEAELRYRTVADFTYDWEYWETPDLRVNYCSPSCERVTGFSAQEFVGDPSLLQRIVHPEDAALWQKHREESLAATEPRAIQFRVVKKDGSVRWVEHAWQPVQGRDGRFLGIRACNRDITERKANEIQTQQLREELAHVSRTTTAGHLAASLAHELNQPLTAILSNAQTARILLAADPPDIKEIRDVLDDIEYDSQRAGGVIQRLRALFKKTGQQRGLLQINDVIRETLDLLRSEFVVNGVSAGVHLEPELPHVLGDRIELQQVVLNLIVNAMDAMSESTPGQRRLHISTCGEQGGTIRISIRDSGPGIQVQPVSQLFEPFFTTKASGMGMGLTISQSILEAHGSSLHAANNADRGATFHFNLPVHRIENA